MQACPFQVDDAETLFNHFRRAGHQFDVEVYNKMIFGWAQKVRVWIILLYLTGMNTGLFYFFCRRGEIIACGSLSKLGDLVVCMLPWENFEIYNP